MNLRPFLLLALSVFLFASSWSVAQSNAQGAVTEGKPSTVEEQILYRLREARPDLEFGNVKPSPLKGYYEVSIDNRQTVYVGEDGMHFFSGELYFAEPGKLVNATEMARSEERQAVLAELPKSDMIIFEAVGKPKAIVNVFTDVTCGYCRKLHDEVAEMNELGIEVRYLAYPRTGIERDGQYTPSYIETSKAWCAKDRVDAMTRLKGGQPLSSGTCDDNPLREQFLLGQKFGVTGTPAIVLADGTLVPGYRSARAYAELLGVPVE